MCVNWLWTRQCHVKDEIKTNDIKNCPKQQSDPTSEKMLNDDTEKLT